MDQIGQNGDAVNLNRFETQDILWGPLNSNIMVFYEQKHAQDVLEGQWTQSMFGCGWSTREVSGV